MGVSALMVFDDLDVESLAIIANEAAGEVEKSARKTVEHAARCGRALLAIKQQTAHGQWLAWLGANFDHSQQTASRYMTIAANYSSMSNLQEAKDVNDALRMIAENPDTPKRERKSSVEVVEPKRPDQKPEKTQGETTTLAVSREDTRKAPGHRPPEKFTAVTPSYDADEDESEADDESPIVEERRDMLDMFEDMKQLIREAMHEFPVNQRLRIWPQLIEQLSEEDMEQW